MQMEPPRTIEELFERKRIAKEERSQRLAKLPIGKKLEIVAKFRDISDDALREDDQRRASQAQPLADKD